MYFEQNSSLQKLLLSACFCWDCRIFLREMEHKYKFDGTIGYVDSYLEFLFRLLKVFRLHAIVHDAVGAVTPRIGEGLGYCYMVGRGPISCSLGHVKGQLFFFYLKLFLPSIFNSVDFWSSSSCILLDNVVTEKKRLKELGVLFDWNVQGYSFRPPIKYKLTKQAV